MTLILILFFFQTFSFAQNSPTLSPASGSGDVLQPFDIPLFEQPFNSVHSGAWPSMTQSLLLSSTFYQSSHTAIDRWLNKKEVAAGNRRLAILGFDLISIYLPLGSAWLHEEWHRATLTHRQVGSENDVYHMKFFSNLIAVSHESDEDLIRFKKDHPAEFVRMSAVGIEAETQQNLFLEKQNFFRDSPSNDIGLLWINTVQNFFYIHTCNSSESTTSTEAQNRNDGDDVSKRDFTGLDCLGWVYDLFRPDEPYQARGIHPSGVGINRYRTLNDLTPEEKDFLKRQEYLNALNFLDPFLFRREEFSRQNANGETYFWNWKAHHYMTSFGYDVGLSLFYKKNAAKFLFTSHNYWNTKAYFPGFSIENIRWALHPSFQLDSRLSIWQQPENQRFDDTRGRFGALIEEKIYYSLSKFWEPYVYLNAKEQGWVAGIVSLDRSVSGGVGIAGYF